ncbi:MAG TPA: Tol-Pal system protein TolB, partial [Xanthobacteraceae bacterium]
MTQHNSSFGCFNRRRAILLGAGAAAAALAGLAPRPAAAVLRLDITQGNVQPIPIALPDFVATGEAETAHDVTRIIASNLQRSGLFLPVDPAA